MARRDTRLLAHGVLPPLPLKEPEGLSDEESLAFWQKVVDDNLAATKARLEAAKPKRAFDVIHRVDIPEIVMTWADASALVQQKVAQGIDQIRAEAEAGGGALVEDSITIRQHDNGVASGMRSFYIEGTALMPEDYRP